MPVCVQTQLPYASNWLYGQGNELDRRDNDPQFTDFDLNRLSWPTFQRGSVSKLGGWKGVNPATPEYRDSKTDCANSGYVCLYDGPKVVTKYMALNQVGYLWAPASGTYNISISEYDDIAMFWIGDKALNGYSRQNADIVAVVNDAAPNRPARSITFCLQVARAYPIRLVYGASGGYSSFKVDVGIVDIAGAPTSFISQSSGQIQRYLFGSAPDGCQVNGVFAAFQDFS